MKIKRILAALSAAALASSMLATAVYADEADETAESEEVAEETTEADGDATVYGIAGVSFQVKDSWEHRDAVGEELLNETGETVFDATCYDVNITGNGEYEVSLEGWWCGMASGFDESEMGWVSLSTTIPVSKNDDGEYVFTDYPDASITINSYTEDGTTYEFEEGLIICEDGGGGLGAWKIVNAWGGFDARGEEFGCVTWQTTDPVIIKFTVSGLPTDKVEEDPIEFKSGNGAPEETDEPEESEAPAESDEPADSSADDTTGDAATDTASSAADSSKADDDSSNLPLYLGIGGGVVVLAAIVAIVIKVKK